MGTRQLNPLSDKFHTLYWDIAKASASQSYCNRHQVGAVVVTPAGMLSVGWNGAPSGLPNVCEDPTGKTLPTTLHAERNAIDKMTRQGIPTLGSILFVTLSPCFECCKAIHGLGLKAIYYAEEHDCKAGWPMLEAAGVPLIAK